MEAPVDVQDRGKDYGSTSSITRPSTESIHAGPSGSTTDDNLNQEHEVGYLFAPRPHTVDTPVGKKRSLSNLDRKEWAFVAFSISSILVVAGLTTDRIVVLPNESPYETFAIVLLVTTAFCLFYVLNGIFGERPYELIIFSVCTLMTMIFCIADYVQTIKPQPGPLTARLIIVLVFGVVNIAISIIFARKYYLSKSLIRWTVGTYDALQNLCSYKFFMESLSKVDFHLEIILVILVREHGAADLSAWELAVLIFGVVYSTSWFFLGFWSVVGIMDHECFDSIKEVYKGHKTKVNVLLASSWIELAYIGYKLVDVGTEWDSFSAAELVPAVIITACVLGLMVRVAVCGFMISFRRNFGQCIDDNYFEATQIGPTMAQ